MSTQTMTPVVSGRPERRVAVRPVTLPRVVRSEWIKLRSLRSTNITLAVSFVLMAGIGLVIAAVNASQWATMSAASRASFDSVGTVLQGHVFTQLTIGALGVLVVTSEYSSGMIRSTFAAVPLRLPVLWAKAGVFGVVTLVTMTIASLIAFFSGMAVLSAHHVQVGFSAPGVAQAVFGAALYLLVVGLIGVGLGALLRNTAAGIASVVGVMLLLPVLVGLLPSSVKTHITPYLPSNAGDALLNVHHQTGYLSPWTGFALMCGYAVVALAGAAIMMRRRDA